MPAQRSLPSAVFVRALADCFVLPRVKAAACILVAIGRWPGIADRNGNVPLAVFRYTVFPKLGVFGHRLKAENSTRQAGQGTHCGKEQFDLHKSVPPVELHAMMILPGQRFVKQ
ncbi:MAG: hypothetical protein HY067_04505 [Betaproteobacteria bacterium]|nr:hypothetical protein [Betaproteobacteria bacterium]